MPVRPSGPFVGPAILASSINSASQSVVLRKRKQQQRRLSLKNPAGAEFWIRDQIEAVRAGAVVAGLESAEGCARRSANRNEPSASEDSKLAESCRRVRDRTHCSCRRTMTRGIGPGAR